MFTLCVATATVSVDTMKSVQPTVSVDNLYFQCGYTNGAATISVDTMEFGQSNKKHHFYMFALTVATATVSVDKILFVYILTTISFFVFTISIATATVSVDTIMFCLYIYHYNCHCNRKCRDDNFCAYIYNFHLLLCR